LSLDRTAPPKSQAAHVERARGHAYLSALIPGLGQATQHRFGAAVIQFGTVAAYVAVALGLGDRRALLLGLAWNVWSVVDAYRREAD
jgi:hypothetical protein